MNVGRSWSLRSRRALAEILLHRVKDYVDLNGVISKGLAGTFGSVEINLALWNGEEKGFQISGWRFVEAMSEIRGRINKFGQKDLKYRWQGPRRTKIVLLLLFYGNRRFPSLSWCVLQAAVAYSSTVWNSAWSSPFCENVMLPSLGNGHGCMQQTEAYSTCVYSGNNCGPFLAKHSLAVSFTLLPWCEQNKL